MMKHKPSCIVAFHRLRERWFVCERWPLLFRGNRWQDAWFWWILIFFFYQPWNLSETSQNQLILCIYWVVPPPSKSHHQDYYIFSRESRTKPSFPLLLGGGTTQCIYVYIFICYFPKKYSNLGAVQPGDPTTGCEGTGGRSSGEFWCTGQAFGQSMAGSWDGNLKDMLGIPSLKITIFPSKYHQHCGFSMAMLVYRRVSRLLISQLPSPKFNSEFSPEKLPTPNRKGSSSKHRFTGASC